MIIKRGIEFVICVVFQSGIKAVHKPMLKCLEILAGPGAYKQVEDYCRTCAVCQITGQQNQQIPRPVKISTNHRGGGAFSKVLIDIVVFMYNAFCVFFCYSLCQYFLCFLMQCSCIMHIAYFSVIYYKILGSHVTFLIYQVNDPNTSKLSLIHQGSPFSH